MRFSQCVQVANAAAGSAPADIAAAKSKLPDEVATAATEAVQKAGNDAGMNPQQA